MSAAVPEPRGERAGRPESGGPESWLHAHGDSLYRYARARVSRRETAEDLVQDTLLSALGSLDRFDGRSSERTWLLAILRHKILDHYRKSQTERAEAARIGHDSRDRTSIEDQVFDGSGHFRSRFSAWSTSSDPLERREFWTVLDGCLARLPRVLASAFVLREIEEMQADEITDALNLSPSNLRVRLYRRSITVTVLPPESMVSGRSPRS